MKRSLRFLVLFSLVLPFSGFSQANLEISLVYDNSILSPMTFTKVLLKSGGIVADSAITDSTGHCTFYAVDSGIYQCIPVCTKPWGGGNAVDCQTIMRNFVHLNGFYLSPFRRWAAEVNGQAISNPASLDALLVSKRFTEIVSTFMPPIAVPGQPDWKYETIDISIPASGNVNQQIRMLCTGDANGSYIP